MEASEAIMADETERAAVNKLVLNAYAERI
jgi:hypothetical protein